jgi:hypothetical protein
MIENEKLMETKWTHSEAVDFCTRIEAVCPEFGCHVALTGGNLYKTGPRKDCDVVFYRIRQVPKIDREGLFAALFEKLNVLTTTSQDDWCFVVKGIYEGRSVDFMFPESSQGGYYPRSRNE